MATLEKLMTVAEYRELDIDDDFLYELLEGELVQKSAPFPFHQRFVGRVYMQLNRFVLERKLGEVLFAPTDVFLDEHTAPQPDLFFISEKNKSFITKDGVFGAPELVIEIISPSSITRDRIQKMRLYHRFGVAEYWIVDPQNQSIEVYRRTPEQYEVFAFAAEKGAVQSQALTGLTIDLTELFAKP